MHQPTSNTPAVSMCPRSPVGCALSAADAGAVLAAPGVLPRGAAHPVRDLGCISRSKLRRRLH